MLCGIVILLTGCASTEMHTLKQIEHTLNLPKADQRSVYDKGHYEDWKGAHHYECQIYRRYEKAEDFKKVEKILLDSGWTLRDQAKLLSHKTSYYYQHKNWSGIEISVLLSSDSMVVFLKQKKPPTQK
jgi:hypothetical protein